jgi:hypothetical protein
VGVIEAGIEPQVIQPMRVWSRAHSTSGFVTPSTFIILHLKPSTSGFVTPLTFIMVHPSRKPEWRCITLQKNNMLRGLNQLSANLQPPRRVTLPLSPKSTSLYFSAILDLSSIHPPWGSWVKFVFQYSQQTSSPLGLTQEPPNAILGSLHSP